MIGIYGGGTPVKRYTTRIYEIVSRLFYNERSPQKGR